MPADANTGSTRAMDALNDLADPGTTRCVPAFPLASNVNVGRSSAYSSSPVKVLSFSLSQRWTMAMYTGSSEPCSCCSMSNVLSHVLSPFVLKIISTARSVIS